MGRAHVWLIVGVMLLWAGTVDASDLNQRLNGDYAFAGEATCLVAQPPGFNTNLTPKDGRFTESFSVQGVRTFNGDGTGTLQGRSVSVVHSDTPVVLGGAASSDFQAVFTYEVAPDRTFTSTLTGPITGTVLTGTRAGQTFTIDNVPLFTGHISRNRQSLTIAHDAPIAEVQTFSTGDVQYRICHRSRVLLRLKAEDDD